MGRAFKFVVLGGGNSAGYAAAEFVKHSVGDGELCIISEEGVPPYERPALSKGYLLKEGGSKISDFLTCVGAEMDPQPTGWYKDNGIELLLNTRVDSVSIRDKSLVTSSGETITYEKLIVATGARALKLEEFGIRGASCKRVYYLRDINDASILLREMALSRGKRAVVIGGGYIGMEVTAALVQNNIQVTLVFPETHLMSRLFTATIAQFYERAYEEKGLNFVKGSVVTSLEKNSQGEVTAVVLQDGRRLECELVVVGVGIKPNISLFEGQLLFEKGGIKVDGHLRSSSSHVYAIGDVASVFLPLYGEFRRLEHVDHARKSAIHAVNSIFDPENLGPYDYLPYFYSRVFGFSWQFYGDNKGQCVYFGDMQENSFGAYWVDEGRVVGCFLEGGSREEYAALADVARDRPKLDIDPLELSEEGLSFALKYREIRKTMESEFVLSRVNNMESRMGLLERSLMSSLAFQAFAGVAVFGIISAVAYYHGKRKKKWGRMF